MYMPKSSGVFMQNFQNRNVVYRKCNNNTYYLPNTTYNHTITLKYTKLQMQL